MYSYPRIIHQIWISDRNKPLPDEWQESINEWKRIYPDYEYILWDNARVNDLLSKNDEWRINFHSFKYLIQRVDYLKYLIMYKYGGIYSDLDLLPKKRFEEHIKSNTDCCVVRSQFKPSYYTNCLLVGMPRTQIWLDLINESVKRKNGNMRFTKHVDVTRTTGSWMLTDVINNSNSSVTILPTSFNPNVLKGEYHTDTFKALNGGSWNGWDTRALIVMYNYWPVLIILIIVVIVILIWLTLTSNH